MTIFVERAEHGGRVPYLGGGDFAVVIGIESSEHRIIVHECGASTLHAQGLRPRLAVTAAFKGRTAAEAAFFGAQLAVAIRIESPQGHGRVRDFI